MNKAVRLHNDSFPDLIQEIANSGAPVAWFADIFINKKSNSSVLFLVRDYVEDDFIVEATDEYVVRSTNGAQRPRPWTVITYELLKARPDLFVASDTL